jgi:hypothetical protein
LCVFLFSQFHSATSRAVPGTHPPRHSLFAPDRVKVRARSANHGLPEGRNICPKPVIISLISTEFPSGIDKQFQPEQDIRSNHSACATISLSRASVRCFPMRIATRTIPSARSRLVKPRSTLRRQALHFISRLFSISPKRISSSAVLPVLNPMVGHLAR